MAKYQADTRFQRLDQFELALCLYFNRASHWRAIERFFAFISRIGDGVFWYSLMAIFALLDYTYGLKAALHMVLVAVVALAIYKILKPRLVRQRPSITWSQIRRGTAPLDLYSFPSGHTMHAVSFTTIALTYYPGLWWLLVPLTVLIALSRVILGLHYPTDVLAGAVIGGSLATLSLQLV